VNYTGWGIKISHILKRYTKLKKLFREKIVHISEKYTKNSFFNGSTGMEMSLIATQNSCSGNLFKNFRTYGSAFGMISLT
jgi:hypothetical protein